MAKSKLAAAKPFQEQGKWMRRCLMHPAMVHRFAGGHPEPRNSTRAAGIALWLSCTCILFAASVTAYSQTSNSQTPQTPVPNPPPKPSGVSPPEANPVPEAKPTPDANDPTETRDNEIKPLPPAVTDAERKKQIADDSAKLLKLATDLKAEVDKTSKDTLSVNVIRKADEIEKLAHSVKEKMKPAAGTN
jgi:hypothetical protein